MAVRPAWPPAAGKKNLERGFVNRLKGDALVIMKPRGILHEKIFGDRREVSRIRKDILGLS